METRNDRIKKALRVAKVTQITLAEHLGMVRQNIVQHLGGSDCNSVEVIQGVHYLTGATYEWLIDGEGREFEAGEEDIKKALSSHERLNQLIDQKLRERGL